MSKWDFDRLRSISQFVMDHMSVFQGEHERMDETAVNVRSLLGVLREAERDLKSIKALLQRERRSKA